VEIVKQVKKMGIKPKPEISMMFGAGAGTHITGYQTKLKTQDELLDEIDIARTWSAGRSNAMTTSTVVLPSENNLIA
jgi:hypothetical protein